MPSAITKPHLSALEADQQPLGRQFLPSYTPVSLAEEADALMAELHQHLNTVIAQAKAAA